MKKLNDKKDQLFDAIADLLHEGKGTESILEELNQQLINGKNTKEVKAYLESLVAAEKSRKFLEEKNANKKQNSDDSSRWVVCYFKKLKEVELTMAKAKHLLLLLTMLEMKSENVLWVSKNKPAKISDVAKVLDVSAKQARRILEEFNGTFLDLEISDTNRIAKVTIKKEFHQMGEQDSKKKSWAKLYKVRIEQLHEKLLAEGKSTIELGLLYKILPYVHYETNYICRYPDYENAEEIEALNGKELADLLGHDEATICSYMNHLYDYGVVLPIGSGKDVIYKVHPDYVMRRPSIYDDFMRKDFAVVKSRKKSSIENRRNRGRKKERI
ncbi:hypothetical protein D1B33_04855 [Lysinibacillus yapensis]|uniref:Uncharacterized protein n=1 Tax=Ureibacillus yapensis TaxID=2304605 RepID=A0A396SB14_9BACL|nr:hypothetical protein [Lysinibacillus yapensis]RHW38220.1 hypothetical protein D1B33_04855 [Lysinibacillus yapensis]